MRRRVNDLLLRLVDTLPRVDGLPPAVLDQARDAVFHADHPFLLVLIGPFGAGKSSLINALLGEAILPTGPVPTTDRIVILRRGPALERSSGADGIETIFHPAPLLEQISLVDTPGLESVFAQHSERTEAFLHRGDLIALVMLATQAMTARNAEYLEALRDYGKRVLVVINQVDLLEAGQAETVRAFVREQCREHLKADPQIFCVSARQGLAAHTAEPPNLSGWRESGLADLEDFLVRALDDRERLRQKLQTPLQIARNALATAQGEVQNQQAALERHRAVWENIEAQVEAARAAQTKVVDAAMTQVAGHFAEAATRGEDAIREMFEPSRALRQVVAGLAELIGVAGLARRFGARPRAAAAFEAREVLAPLDEVTKVVDGLGPRLEGRDLQDLDDLAAYTKRALNDLPPALRAKVIGEVRTPATYDREALRRIRPELDGILAEARQIEPARLERAVRNTLIALAGWEVAVVLALALIGSLGINWTDPTAPLLLLLIAIALILTGLALMPLRGMLMARAFSGRLMALADRLQELVREAAAEQIEQGVRLRQDVAAPFTRLVSAQTELHSALARDLRALDGDLAALAGEVGGLWKGR